MRIWRSRPPLIATSPTPSTVSRIRRIFLSVISVVSRMLRSLATATVMTGSESGSAFWMTGGMTFGGSWRIAPATFSRTSCAASSMFRSSTNWTVIVVVPSVVRPRSSSMPLMVDRASSMGSTTCVTISSGWAPGRRTLTKTVAGSAFGKRSTPRSRNEKIPSTTRKPMSITEKTGRLTQISARVIASPVFRRRSRRRLNRYRGANPPTLRNLFKGIREPQYVEITLMTTDDLQPDRKPVIRKTARDRDRGKAGQRDGVTGSHPINVAFHHDAIDLSDPIRLDRKRRDLRHGQDQEFVSPHELPHAVIKLRALRLGARDVHPAQPQSLFDIPD